MQSIVSIAFAVFPMHKKSKCRSAHHYKHLLNNAETQMNIELLNITGVLATPRQSQMLLKQRLRPVAPTTAGSS